MSERDAYEDVVEALAHLLKVFGLSEPVSRVLSVLISSDKPLTQEEVSRATGYSASMVCTSLSFLEKIGFVIVVGKKGRRKLYVAAISVVEIFEKFLKDFVEKRALRLLKVLRDKSEGVKEVPGSICKLAKDTLKLIDIINIYLKIIEKT